MSDDRPVAELANDWLMFIRNGYRGTSSEEFGWNEALGAMSSSDLTAFRVMIAVASLACTDEELASIDPWMGEFLVKSGGAFPAEIGMEFDTNPWFRGFVIDWMRQTLARWDFPVVLSELLGDRIEASENPIDHNH